MLKQGPDVRPDEGEAITRTDLCRKDMLSEGTFQSHEDGRDIFPWWAYL